MRPEELLSRLEAVRSRGAGRWSSKCPGHDDRNPSLSIRQGDKGVLLRCWAGCSLAEICAALGMTPSQLFYDAGGSVNREAIQRTQARRHAARTRQRAKGRRADAFREAEAVLRAATNVDISQWSDEQIDTALNRVCDARELLEREDTDATQSESVSA